MTDDSALKKQIRARMAVTGEKYTVARRMIMAGHDQDQGQNQGQPTATVRVYLNPHVDLKLTAETAQAYAEADEPGRQQLASRLLMEKNESGEARLVAGSEIMTDQHARAEAEAAQEAAIRGAVQRSIERVVGLSAVEVDLAAERVRVSIRAARPDLAWGFVRPVPTDGAVWREVEADQLRKEVEELTGRPVQLDIQQTPSPPETPTAQQEMPTSKG